jgi:ribose transport system substrate-binding protein
MPTMETQMALARRFRTVLGTIPLVAVLVACSSSGDTSGSSGSSGGGTSASTGGSASANSGVDAPAAQAIVDQYSKAPTSLNLPALSKKPPTGKYLITLETPEPVSKQKDEAIAAAAKVLGWKYETIPIGTASTGAQDAFNEALQRKPDYIHFSGTPASLLEAQLESAKQQGVKVIADSTVDPATPPIISTAIDSTAQVSKWGEMIGAYVVAQSKEPTKVAIVTVPAYPILGVFTKGVQDSIKKLCSTCNVEVLPQQISDLGKATPNAVVSAVQRDPSIKWVLFSFGDLATGVTGALQAANLGTDIKIGGETPSSTNLQALRDGTEAVWPGFPTSILGWRVVDMLARDTVGDDLKVAGDALMPTQLLTPDNIDGALFDDAGFYVGVKDYQAQFKQLWKVS